MTNIYCFDTSVVADLFRGNTQLREKMILLQHSGNPVALTSISLCELYKGVFSSQRKEENKTLLDQFVKSITFLTHTHKSCELFGMDYVHLKEKGKLTSLPDLMIASICKASRCTLITRDHKGFKDIPNLNIEYW